MVATEIRRRVRGRSGFPEEEHPRVANRKRERVDLAAAARYSRQASVRHRAACAGERTAQAVTLGGTAESRAFRPLNSQGTKGFFCCFGPQRKREVL